MTVDELKAESFILKLIRKHQGRIAYWSISKRAHAALKRLEKRGAIDWKVVGYPYLKFTIRKQMKGSGK